MGEVTQTGADEIVAAAGARRTEGVSGPGTGARHLLVPLTIEVTGDTARAVSYYAFLSGPAIMGTGTYHDALTRTPNGWQIACRDVTPG